MDAIQKSGAIIIQDGKLLCTRAKHTTIFIMPGGKPEQGENAAQALIRELQEELSIAVNSSDLQFFGAYDAEAANHKGRIVHMQVYIVLRYTGELTASSETEELLWMNSKTPTGVKIGSIIEHNIVPKLARQGLIE